MNSLSMMGSYLIAGAILLLMLIGLVFVGIMPVIDRWSRHFLMALLWDLVLIMIASIVDMSVAFKPEYVLAEKAAIFAEFLLLSVICPMMLAYLQYSCGEDLTHSAALKCAMIVWLAFFIMLILSQFTTWFYYITPDNQFFTGPLYPLMMLPLFLILLIYFAVLIHSRSRLSLNYFVAFFLYTVIAVFTIVVQKFYVHILITDAGAAICSILISAAIMSDQLEQNRRQQREIYKQRTSIMVLQMRPHFIYNTMMSIYYLCEQDPEKAQQITLDFTTYLRRNFTAIASEEMIPFFEELEHTRAYLAVEQAQFEDQLFVDYDIPHTEFRIPPLTLQPIVENAVKHGLDPDADPLSISVRTRDTGRDSVIIVEDNGSGNDSGTEDGLHIALTNIRERLGLMCRGTITISPREGGGTVVEVRIPY